MLPTGGQNMFFMYGKSKAEFANELCIVSGQLQFTDLVCPVYVLKN